jgi:hypothetical protein
MYAMSKTEPEHRLSDGFKHSRQYLRQGIPYLRTLWPSAPKVQWNGSHPGLEALGERNVTYVLATVKTKSGLFGFVHLHNLGLFAMKLAEPEDGPNSPDTVTLYHRNKTEDERYVLSEELIAPEAAATFARSAEATQQV